MVGVLDADMGAGWVFLGALLKGEASALELSRHRFLAAAGPTT